jgi:poly(3-hydroxybutyrate) depolymerase
MQSMCPNAGTLASNLHRRGGEAHEQRVRRMMYEAYQAQADAMEPMRAVAKAALPLIPRSLPVIPDNNSMRRLAAAYELISRSGLTHRRPPFGIGSVAVGNREVEVREEIAHSTPFCNLLHFRKDISVAQPRLLLVAPMSGHFATLLRGTVQTLLAEHDLYITDWRNCRDVSLRQGRFGLDEYVDHLIAFLEFLGPGAHMVAICQPSVAALAATAIMSEDGNPAQPRSLTLMAGPIDTRINPTKVNNFATSHSLRWFERNLITHVPLRFAGALRRVYPGFLQLIGFMSMNLERHIKSQTDLFNHLAKGETAQAAAIRDFYDEYFAVMDLPAEFFLETISLVFQENAIAKGALKWRGRKVDPGGIQRMALLTVEGERDDICSVGQTLAAQELCSALRPYKKIHHVQTGVGHYGVFSGRRWNAQVYPILRDVIHMSD